MSKLFGTDGVRGVANEYPVTADLCVKLAAAAGIQLVNKASKSPRVIIAKDTRLSGYLIEYALTSGFISVGMEVILVGPMPTPAVSLLVRSMRADFGVMVSASHNPYQYNGIKFFNGEGEKISTELEDKIEASVMDVNGDFTHSSITGEVGKTYRLDDAQGRYIEFLKSTFDKGLRLDGLKIVVDAANGAAYRIAPTTLWELGAEVITVGAQPNGYNINDRCGATHPRNIATEVLKNDADLGIALDGDADRVVMCDENGQIMDGDRILSLLALDMKNSSELSSNSVVVTEMSNMAFDRYMEGIGVTTHRTVVGDKFVYSKMREVGSNLGGESSGHIILGDFNKTGDGLVAALRVLAGLIKNGKSLSWANDFYTPYPRVQSNVTVKDKGILESQEVVSFIKGAKKKISGGRILVRPSGTEPVIRILAEGEDEKLMHGIVTDLEELLNKLQNDVIPDTESDPVKVQDECQPVPDNEESGPEPLDSEANKQNTTKSTPGR